MRGELPRKHRWEIAKRDGVVVWKCARCSTTCLTRPGSGRGRRPKIDVPCGEALMKGVMES